MKKIKFSEDYEKLLIDWDGTQALLLGVFPDSIERLKKDFLEFIKKDTKIRGEDRDYPLNFKDGLILVFLHKETGELFSTLRRNYKEKFEYYASSIGVLKCCQSLFLLMSGFGVISR